MVQNVYQAIKMNRKAKYSQLEDNLGVSDGGSGDISLIRFCLGTAAGLRPAVTNVSSWECLQKSGTWDRFIGSLFRVDVPSPMVPDIFAKRQREWGKFIIVVR